MADHADHFEEFVGQLAERVQGGVEFSEVDDLRAFVSVLSGDGACWETSRTGYPRTVIWCTASRLNSSL